MDSDAEVDAEISQMSEETLADLEKQHEIRMSTAEKDSESMILSQIKVLRRNHDESMRE